MEDRPWDLWDRPGVTAEINRIWHVSPAEHQHRKRNATITLGCLNSKDSFLEVGCGSGLMYAFFKAMADIHYVGVDTSEEMLKTARKTFPEADFRKGDGFHLDFADRSFDVVAAYEVLLHLPDIVPFIREMVRVARKYVIFTLRVGSKTHRGSEVILGNRFESNIYSRADAEAKVKEASGGLSFRVESLGDVSTLWIGQKV